MLRLGYRVNPVVSINDRLGDLNSIHSRVDRPPTPKPHDLEMEQNIRNNNLGEDELPRRKWRYKMPKMDVAAEKRAMTVNEEFEEYDIEKMEMRADKLSDVPQLKKRARRFDEETANELIQVSMIKLGVHSRLSRSPRERHEAPSENTVKLCIGT